MVCYNPYISGYNPTHNPNQPWFFSWLNWDHISNYRFLSEFLKTKFQTKKKRENELLKLPSNHRTPSTLSPFPHPFHFSLAELCRWSTPFIGDGHSQRFHTWFICIYIYIKCTENPELLYRWSCFFSHLVETIMSCWKPHGSKKSLTNQLVEPKWRWHLWVTTSA